MPTLPPSTAKILAYKVLDRDFDSTWPDWAVDMLAAGFETEHLLILAGMRAPFDYFEMKTLSTKALHELGLDFSDKLQTVFNYVNYFLRMFLDGQSESIKVLREIRDLYLELDYEKSLQYFNLLYYAKSDLTVDEEQWYIDGVDRNNIEEKIEVYFKQWLLETDDQL